jgi:hypothetical protein
MGVICNIKEVGYEHRILLNLKVKPLMRPGSRWEYDTMMDHKEIGCENVDCIYMAQNKSWWCTFADTNGLMCFCVV